MKKHAMVVTAAVMSINCHAPTAWSDEATPPPGGAVSVDAHGAVKYQFDADDLPGAVLRTVYGTKLNDSSCHFEFSGSGEKDEVLVTREVEFRPDDCTIVLAEARYRAGSALASRFVGASAGGADPLAEPLAAKPLRTVVEVAHVDPVGVLVNSATSGQVWTNSSVRSYINNTYMLQASGWYRSYYSGYGHRRTTYTSATFRNNKFCVTNPTTKVTYSRAKFTTYSNGKYDYSHSTQKSGSCSSWLSLRGFGVLPVCLGGRVWRPGATPGFVSAVVFTRKVCIKP